MQTQKQKQTQKPKSYCQLILAHLQAGHSITEIEAIQKWNMTCLTQRIFDLKRRGYPIVSVFETNNGKRYKRHFLGEPK